MVHLLLAVAALFLAVTRAKSHCQGAVVELSQDAHDAYEEPSALSLLQQPGLSIVPLGAAASGRHRVISSAEVTQLGPNKGNSSLIYGWKELLQEQVEGPGTQPARLPFSGAWLAALWPHLMSLSREVLMIPGLVPGLPDPMQLTQGDYAAMARNWHLICRRAPTYRTALQEALARRGIRDELAKRAGRPGPLVLAILSDPESICELLELISDASVMERIEQANELHEEAMVELLFAHSRVLRRKWDDFVAPAKRLVWALGIFGHIAIVVTVYGLTRIRGPSLAQEAGKGASSSDLEKALRRSITVEELQEHAKPGDVWLAIDGMVCDVTEFTAAHPGGADLLLQSAGTDATGQFREVGHSNYAVQLISERLVGVLCEGAAPSMPSAQAALQETGSASKGALAGFKRSFLSLFTKEDPYNLHKILGLAVIAHYLARYVILCMGLWLRDPSQDAMLFDGGWFSLLSVWLCFLLQVSSFQFVLPRNRVLGRPMLWQEWRAHNFIFVMRSLVAFTASWLSVRFVFFRSTETGKLIVTGMCFGAVLFQLYFADVASRLLRESKHESLTASWPLWEGCPRYVEHFFKAYYSFGINQLTAMALKSGTLSTFSMNLTGILILQTDSFAMTLVRKNIISTSAFHGYYLGNMWHALLIGLQKTAAMTPIVGLASAVADTALAWTAPLAVYVLRCWGLSKYGCWIGVMATVCASRWGHLGRWAHLAPVPVWLLWALVQFGFAGYVFEYRVRRFLEGGRAKPLLLRSRERITASLWRLRLEVPKGYACGLMPGQHLRVLAPNASRGQETWNAAPNAESSAELLSRAYTPISAPDASSFELLVKHYPPDAGAGFPQGGRASAYLLERLAVGEAVLVSGPHGQRIYHGNGLFALQVGQPKMRPRRCCVLAGGSGITPALAVLRELQAEIKRKVRSTEAWRMMDYENQVEVEAVHVLHVNRTEEDGLPLSFYQDASLEQQLLPVHVCNLATRTKGENQEEAPLSNSPEQQAARWQVKHGDLTCKLLAEVFPAPAEEVLVIVCGPRHFIVTLCQPLLRECGFEQVLTLW